MSAQATPEQWRAAAEQARDYYETSPEVAEWLAVDEGPLDLPPLTEEERIAAMLAALEREQRRYAYLRRVARGKAGRGRRRA